MTAIVAVETQSAPQSARHLVTGDGITDPRERTLRSQESASALRRSGKAGPVRLSASVRHPGCGVYWTGSRTAHCARCHVTTSGIRAFEAHQRIAGGILHCLPPDKAGLVPAERPWGVLWTLPADDSAPWIATKPHPERED